MSDESPMEIKTINPSNESLINVYRMQGILDIRQSIERANLTQKNWMMLSDSDREACFYALARLLREKLQECAELITLEMGKPISLSLQEILKCALLCEHYALNAKHYLKSQHMALEDKTVTIFHEPLGVILGIMPWNFPFWQVFRFAIPTLAARNAVLFKHAPITTGCGVLIERLFKEAGFPEHLMRQLVIDEADVPEVLMHSAVQGVSLTGSERAGRCVASVAGLHLKKSVLELGGNDPYLVMGDADLETSAELIVAGRISNCGQVCVAPKRIIVMKEVLESFSKLVKEKLQKIQSGDPNLLETHLGPMARGDLRVHLHQQVIESIDKGAECLLGGIIPIGPGFFYPPTLLRNVRIGMPAFHEELFGPVISLITAHSIDEAVQLANQSSYGLGAGVFSKNLDLANGLAQKISAGSVAINGLVASDPRVPFGGVKNSGYGCELGQEGILEFTSAKTITLGVS